MSILFKDSFNFLQMQQIRRGLRHAIDVSKYADSRADWRSMQKVRIKLHKEKFHEENKITTIRGET